MKIYKLLIYNDSNYTINLSNNKIFIVDFTLNNLKLGPLRLCKIP